MMAKPVLFPHAMITLSRNIKFVGEAFLSDFDPFTTEIDVVEHPYKYKVYQEDDRFDKVQNPFPPLMVREVVWLPWPLGQNKNRYHVLSFAKATKAHVTESFEMTNGKLHLQANDESWTLNHTWDHLKCCPGPFAYGELQKRKQEQSKKRSRSESPERMPEQRPQCVKGPCCKQEFVFCSHKIYENEFLELWVPHYLVDLTTMEAKNQGRKMPNWTTNLAQRNK